MVEISGVHVKLTGDSSNLNSALDDAQGELKDTQKDAEDTSKSLRGMGKAFLGAAAAAAGIVGVGSLFKSIASEGEKFETAMLKINAIIKATGGVAGKTGEELRESAKALALNTLESTEGVLAAQQRLLTFRNITGDVFDRTIAASADLAAAMGQDLSGASVMLGRALEDPVRGVTALTRTGTVFTDQQKEMIKTLVESGELQKAQTFILKELEDQYGGTAVAAAQGYAGALDTLGQRQQEFLLAINETLGVTDALAAAVNGIANVFKLLTENIKRVISYIAATAIAAMFAFRGAIVAGALSITKLMIPALTGLRAALIRTGIGALIVGLGELIFQITRAVGFFQDLIKATGGIGAAMSLLAR
jgi:phage-related minor tail protein